MTMMTAMKLIYKIYMLRSEKNTLLSCRAYHYFVSVNGRSFVELFGKTDSSNLFIFRPAKSELISLRLFTFFTAIFQLQLCQRFSFFKYCFNTI